MIERSFIVRLYAIDTGVELPVGAYMTSRTFYQKFVKDAQFEINGNVQYLVDSIEDGKDTGILVFEGDKVFYTGKNDRKLIPITVHTGYVSLHDPEKQYFKYDVVWHAGALYSRVRDGKGMWDSDDWVKVESGHQIPTISVYNSLKLDAKLFELAYGVFFYGDRLEYATDSYEPGTEPKEVVKDTTAFYEGMVMHDNLRWFDDL